MPQPKTIEVVNPAGGRAVRVPGHGIVAASGRPHTVPLSDDVKFLLACGALTEQPTSTDTPEED